MELNKMYSLTLNPVDKYQFYGQDLRLLKFRNFVYEQLLTLAGDYTLVVELSEPLGMKTQGYTGPRLHMHGVIVFRKKEQLYKFLLTDYYKLTRWTSIDIDTIDDITVWMDYILKQDLVPKKRRYFTNNTEIIDLEGKCTQ